MGNSVNQPEPVVLALPDLAATERLAEVVSREARRGDVIALSGDLGTGKTAFARAFIRARARARGLVIEDVPSPTFTIVQIYDDLEPAVWHVDLYRLEHLNETTELGLEEGYDTGITLIEWPDRLGDDLPAARLDLELRAGDTEEARVARLGGDARWTACLADWS
jgi:tRNA threonylcarbamoyladenosine biosynthesis protein TsaE